MKKNIIMIIIILICSVSLLLVLYYFNSKNIYYISDKIIDNNEITMQIKIGSTYTNLETLNDLDSSKYYRISNETNCTSGTASFYYSNSTSKLKIKVTNNPLKCKIVFEEIIEDINIISMTLDNAEINAVPVDSLPYSIDYSCNDGSYVIWDNSYKKLKVEGARKKTYCTVNFHNENYTDKWKMWAQWGGINPNNYNSFQEMMNNVQARTTILSSEAANYYLLTNDDLITSFKALTNYESELVASYLSLNTLGHMNSYAAGLPFYLVFGTQTNSIGGIVLKSASQPANALAIYGTYFIDLAISYSGNLAYFTSTQPLYLTKYNKIKFHYDISHDYPGELKCEASIGLQATLADDNNFDVGPIVTTAFVSTTNYNEILDISQVLDREFLKFRIYHGSQTPGYTCYIRISDIYIY